LTQISTKKSKVPKDTDLEPQVSSHCPPDGQSWWTDQWWTWRIYIL